MTVHQPPQKQTASPDTKTRCVRVRPTSRFFPSLALAAGSPGTNGTEVICKGDEFDKEANMNRTLVGIILFAAGAATTPAFADFYIVQDASTHRCRIVEERPAPSVGVVVGSPFGARVEAESHMRTVEVCREGTTGSGDDVTIERRERVR